MTATVTHLSPAGGAMSPEQTIHSALQLDATEVIVFGYDGDGDLFVRASHMSLPYALWLTEQLRVHILQQGGVL